MNQTKKRTNGPASTNTPFNPYIRAIAGAVCIAGLSLSNTLYASDTAERTMEPQVDSSGSSPVINFDVVDRLDQADFNVKSKSGNTGSSSGGRNFASGYTPSSGGCSTVWVLPTARWSYSDYIPGVYISYRMQLLEST